MMPPLPPPPPPSITIAPTPENDITIRSRSGSVTPRHQQQHFETDATEDDDLTCTSSSIYQYELNNNNNHKKDDAKPQHEQFKNALNENDFIDNLDENDIENFETSKIKMKLMQKQLYDLTNLVNQALINKDLNQLAAVAQYNMQNSYTKNMVSTNFSLESQHQSNNQIGNHFLSIFLNNYLQLQIKLIHKYRKTLYKMDMHFLKNMPDNMSSFAHIRISGTFVFFSNLFPKSL